MEGTTAERIMDLLSDGNFHHSNEICSPFVGGRQGGARLSELRHKGVEIEDRWTEDGKYKEYRLVSKPRQMVMTI